MGLVKTLSAVAVEAIIADLNDRSGLQNAWDDIDDDARKEIRTTWRMIVEKAFSDSVSSGE